VTGFLEDLNPALLSTINSEFDKVANQTAPEPTRQSEELQRTASSGAAASGPRGHATTDPLDDLIPRVDLDKLVASTAVIADSKSDSWKVRKEAFEALLAVLEQKSNSRLKPNMGE
jgi:cytoskeleton-associated protein 5